MNTASKIILGATAVGAATYGILTKAELYPAVPKADPNKKHILCIGDSLTYGARYQLKPDQYSYPACLNKLVQEHHPDWEVLNFGLSGRTVDINGDFPYMKEKLYRESLKIPADIIVIMFGGNDSKLCNVIGGISSIVDSYQHMINAYRETNPNCKILCMLPYFPKIYNYGISGKGTTLVRSAERKLFASCEPPIKYIDLNTVAWLDPDFFFGKDGVHPTREGCYEIAYFMFEESIKNLIK